MEDAQFQCATCEIKILGMTNFQRHVESLEHANRIQLKNLGNKTDGDKIYSSSNTDSAQQVISGKRSIEESMDADRKLSSLKCEPCKKQFTGYEPFQQHLDSAGHKKKLGLFPDPNHSISSVRCSECEKDYFGPYELHIITDTHKKGVLEKNLNQKENPFDSLASQYKKEYKSDSQLQNNQDAVLKESSSQAAAYQDNSTPSNSDRFACDICDKCFSGPVPFEQHMSSNVHKKKVRDMEILNKMQNKTCLTESVFVKAATDMPSTHPQRNYYCDVCDKNCSGPVPYEQHINSMQHKKKEQDKKVLTKFSTTSSNDQVDSTSDYGNLSVCSNFNASNTDKIPESGDNLNKSQLPSFNQNGSLLLKCDICDKTFTGSVPYEQHINSIQHMKKQQDKKLLSKFLNTSSNDQVDCTSYYGNLSACSNFNASNTVKIPESVDNLNEPQLPSFNHNGSLLLKCDICDKSFNGSIPYQMHMDSIIHQKKMLQKSIMANGENKSVGNSFSINGSLESGTSDIPYYCKMCDKHCSGSVPFRQHIISDAHCKKARSLEIEEKLKELNNNPMITEHASEDSIEDNLLEQVENKNNDTSPRAQQANSDLIMGGVLKDLNFITPETLNVTTFNVNEKIVFDAAL